MLLKTQVGIHEKEDMHVKLYTNMEKSNHNISISIFPTTLPNRSHLILIIGLNWEYWNFEIFIGGKVNST